MNRQTLTLAAALSCGIGLYLIGGESEPPVAIPATRTELAQPATSESPESSSPTDNPSAESETIEQESNDAQLEKGALKIAFEAPFPDRVNLFHAPKRQGKGATKASGQSESAVELLGFVNVDGQRVVLSIDGMVSPIAEGEKQDGIEVISIQPPTVVLQRGRQRWQTSLPN